jgi:hypothetical protein
MRPNRQHGGWLAVATMAVAMALPAGAAAQAAPHYDFAQALPLNQPGTPLPSETGGRDLSIGHSKPKQQPGLEFSCAAGTGFSTSTLWYEVHPHRAGTLRVGALSQTTGFSPYVGVIAYDPATGAYDTSRSACSTTPNAAGETYAPDIKVGAGSNWRIVVGGVVGRPITEGNFVVGSFFAPAGTPIGSGTGPRIGRINAEAKLSAGRYLRRVGNRYIKLGILIRRLVVRKVPSAGTVIASCTRGACRSVRLRPNRAGQVTLTNLTNRRLRTGVRVQIRVTAPGRIGDYIAYTIKPNDFSKVERCLPAGSLSPRKSC